MNGNSLNKKLSNLAIRILTRLFCPFFAFYTPTPPELYVWGEVLKKGQNFGHSGYSKLGVPGMFPPTGKLRRKSTSKEILQFDVEAYLRSRGIAVSHQSEHTSHGYVNIQCPFCGDQSDHLGINTTTKAANCWVCGGKSIARIIATLEGGCSYAEANTVIKEFANPAFGLMYEQEEPVHPRLKRRNIIPAAALGKEHLNKWPNVHVKYLRDRRFNPSEVVFKYDLYAMAQTGKFSWRIIIPVYQNGRVVTFSSMDITKHRAKYLACPNQRGVVEIKDTIYNIDNVGNTMLILEGYTDVWRVGDGSVAVMGLQFTPRQLRLIAERSPRQAVILFDGEDPNRPDFEEKHRLTLAQARKLAVSLKGLVRNVDVMEMSHNDPGDLLEDEVAELRKLVFDDSGRTP